MASLKYLKAGLIGGASVVGLATGAFAASFNIPGGDLESALDVYTAQTGVQLIYAATEVRGVRTRGAKGDLSVGDALTRILTGTGFAMHRHSAGSIAIVHDVPEDSATQQLTQAAPMRMAAAAAAAAGIESVVVTSSKIKGDIQTVPIAITALSQEQLTSRQIAGGPDLVKEVPNLTFSKTNFTGYNIQIRGIGTQAISVTTDPAVAVALNDIPFIRNHFFEQEFYDVGQVEVLRGPQGTLYGRNATAGVVNVVTAKPTDQFEAMASADIGNYHNRRFEGMVNVPIVDDRLDLRVAGEWTKRDGYSFNALSGSPIDGRDLWSSRVTLDWKPAENLQTSLVWEHFSESDDRLRSGKQLCTRDPGPTEVDGVSTDVNTYAGSKSVDLLSQGCLPSSLYSPLAFQVPNGASLQVWQGVTDVDTGTLCVQKMTCAYDPYASATQSSNLRVIESQINPKYQAKNDTLEFNAEYNPSPALTFSSQTGYNSDFLWSAEDYSRFASAPQVYNLTVAGPGIDAGNNVFCDPQLGCSDRFLAEDLSDEHAWQFSQEFRLSSNFSGPFNFSFGGNYLHYETSENYYVFINALTLIALAPYEQGFPPTTPYQAGVTTDSFCLGAQPHQIASLGNGDVFRCSYIDPNPIGSLDNKGHNYFLSQNPYVLNSYAGFGEAYYNVTPELKLTGGLRWTDDQKHFISIPSEVVTAGYGYPVSGVIDQSWNQWTGRFATNWTPKFDFTDQTLLYASYAHGYKAGGANPPGAQLLSYFGSDTITPIHPKTFAPEFIDAYELGTKNTLLDGGLTLNGDVFFYNYKGYQISRIVDRTAINDNFDATVKGAELEAQWEPAPGLKFNFAGGYEDTRIDNGQSSIDLMDRTAGTPNWLVVRPFITQASNCIIPDYVVLEVMGPSSSSLETFCGDAYTLGGTYPGFDPRAGTPGDPYTGQNINPATGVDYGPAPNNGEGFAKPLGGNALPNAPHFTTSLSADYTMPVSEDWAATLHSDFYWQSQSWARVFNDRSYDKLRGYSNVNLALILTSAGGWQVMGYLKNVFDTTAITGDFLNSDDTDLTTNVFLTDPRLYGVRVTKNF